jgi:hypothetical protein
MCVSTWVVCFGGCMGRDFEVILEGELRFSVWNECEIAVL